VIRIHHLLISDAAGLHGLKQDTARVHIQTVAHGNYVAGNYWHDICHCVRYARFTDFAQGLDRTPGRGHGRQRSDRTEVPAT